MRFILLLQEMSLWDGMWWATVPKQGQLLSISFYLFALCCFSGKHLRLALRQILALSGSRILWSHLSSGFFPLSPLKYHLSSSSSKTKGRVTLPKRMNFWKSSKRPLTLPHLQQFNREIAWRHTLKRPFCIIFMLKKPYLRSKICNINFWIGNDLPHPPFGTFPTIHPFW